MIFGLKTVDMNVSTTYVCCCCCCVVVVEADIFCHETGLFGLKMVDMHVSTACVVGEADIFVTKLDFLG